MKISKESLAIFKNFASINSNLILHPGSKINTISAGKNILAEAIVAESFPVEFGIYDLNEFLGAMSLFADPELEFSEKWAVIREGKNSVKYFAASSNVLTKVPNIKAFPEPDITFDLSATMLSQIQKVSSILKVTDFSVVGDGEVMSILVGNKANTTGNTFVSDIGPTTQTFCIDFKIDNLKLMAGDYSVAIAGKKMARFQAASQQLLYFVAVEL
jgi:hypothetical protein